MFYHLFGYLEKLYDFPGAGLFQYISFRAGAAVITSLVISLLFGKKLINFLKKMQVGETIRDLGLEGQMEKQGTPTMGGLIILGAILVPTLLFADLTNIYIIIILVTTVWLGIIGFIDDYIKVFKKDKEGLAGRFKIIGQVILGFFVGAMMYFSPEIVIREKTTDVSFIDSVELTETLEIGESPQNLYSSKNVKSTKSTIPFFKNNEFDYAIFVKWLGDGYEKWAFLFFIPIVILIITAVSNGANLTDGMDGLATGVSAIIGITLAIFAYVSGNIFFANYLNIMYIPNTGELVIYIAAFVGACIGFLWYNAYPAQVFMGDTGSLAIGGIIAVFAIMLRKELLIPLLCGIFLAESLSVVIQVSYFKYSRKRFGTGRRIFKMAPLHHHYQLEGYAEPKIVLRFFIVGIMLAVFTVITLKIR
ncbi:MAG TPA: phospho-N-acetylmuramoyl-pentapeptide-transferase [Bacteroidales bacterium]|nr:phospho-N-acetylmuramoyl-pentapeptide-transferase [Bacteroidales bacterium]HRW96089.1 phospho-N-acetylmuramoyl-pentapeptide-transferase [Bacteroidales bacterium]